MSNYDAIRNMSDAELAEFVTKLHIAKPPKDSYDKAYDRWAEILGEEVE